MILGRFLCIDPKADMSPITDPIYPTAPKTLAATPLGGDGLALLSLDEWLLCADTLLVVWSSISSSVGSTGLILTKTCDIPRDSCDRSVIGATWTSHIGNRSFVPAGWSKNRPLKSFLVSASCKSDIETFGISCTIWMTFSTGIPITCEGDSPVMAQNALLI